MGLGKTVQSISFLSYLAGSKDIWGPFLIVAPNSTLHQWQQEVTRFCPELKVLPYWGSAKERQILRQFWTSKQMYTKDAPFHVLITSYNVVVADEKYFHRMRFMYMILDEAQAIKNAASQRWKCLLNLKCRNRVLLTGTPIQNRSGAHGS
jgi:DNA helicase INO80